MTKIVLWVPDQALQSQIKSILNEAGYEVTLTDKQILTGNDIENWEILILHMEVIQQTNDIFPFLSKVRRVSKCKVLILSERQFYPLIGNDRLGIDQWVDWVLYFPIDKDELLGNVRRYLGHI
jgi:DNA-binding response OmpR family regulator